MTEPNVIIGFDKLHSRIRDAGGVISRDQLERWRGKGLLPPVVQKRSSPSGGSIVQYPAMTVPMALEISSQLEKKRDLTRAGFELWWQGYDVPEEFWKPLIEGRSKWLRSAITKIAKALERAERDDNFGDQLSDNLKPDTLPTPLRGAARNLSFDCVNSALSVLINAVGGNFEEFYFDDVEARHSAQAESVNKLLGFNQAKTDLILGQRLDTMAALADVISVLARSTPAQICESPLNDKRQAELCMARNDVRNAIGMAANLYNSLLPIYGPKAFGLKLCNRIFDSASPELRVELVLLWIGMRRAEYDEFLSSHQIENLYRDAIQLRQLSDNLLATIEQNSAFREKLTMTHLKAGLADRNTLARLLVEIRELSLS